MRYLAELFVKKGGQFSEAYLKKVKQMQETDKVGQDVTCTILGKQVQFVLPPEIKTQYKMLLDAECFVNSSLFSSTDEVYELNMRMWGYAKSNMRVGDKDGYKMDDADFSVEFMEQAIMIYLSELLFPLFHRSCTSVETILKQNLTEFMTESEEK
jgi:hypothetical protein